MVLIPNWERVVVGNLSDKLGPNWELGPNCAAAANSVGIGWESGSPKNSVGAPKTKMRYTEIDYIRQHPRIRIHEFIHSYASYQYVDTVLYSRESEYSVPVQECTPVLVHVPYYRYW